MNNRELQVAHAVITEMIAESERLREVAIRDVLLCPVVVSVCMIVTTVMLTLPFAIKS